MRVLHRFNVPALTKRCIGKRKVRSLFKSLVQFQNNLVMPAIILSRRKRQKHRARSAFALNHKKEVERQSPGWSAGEARKSEKGQPGALCDVIYLYLRYYVLAFPQNYLPYPISLNTFLRSANIYHFLSLKESIAYI